MQRLALYLWPVLLVLAAIGWTRLRINTNIEHTLGKDIPSVDALITLKDNFAIGGNLRIMVSTPASDDPGSVEQLPEQAVDDLRGALAGSQALAELGVAPEANPEARARYWIGKQVGRGRAYLSEASAVELRDRLEPAALASRFERHKLRLATPQPAEVTRQMIRDPLSMRDLIPEAEVHGGGTTDLSDSDPDSDLREIDAASFNQPPDALAGAYNAERTAWRINLAVPFPGADAERSAKLKAALDALLDGLRDRHPKLGFDAAGGHLMAAEAAGRVKADVKGTVIFASIGLAVIFLVVWRRVVPIVVLSVSTAAALFTAFGLYGLTGWVLSPLAALSGGMLAGLGVDYGIHLITELNQARPDDPTPPMRRARMAARSLARPIITACATTTCGFLALAATEPDALVQLAGLGSLGLACAGLASLTLLPTLAGVVDPSRPGRAPNPKRPPRLLLWALARPRALRNTGIALCVALVVSLVAAYGSPGDDRLHDLHPQPNPVLESQRRIEQTFGDRQGSALVLIEADSPDALHERLQALHALDLPFTVTSALRLLPEAGADARNADLFADLVPAEVKRDMLDAAQAAGFRPAAFEPAAEFVQRFIASPSPGLADLARADEGGLFFPAAFDPSSPMTVAVLSPTRAWDTGDARRDDLSALRDALRAVPGSRATGLDLISEQLRGQIERDLLRAFGWSALPIAVVLMVSLRRLRRVLLTVVPPVMGLVAAGLAQQLGSGQWNVVTLAAVPLVLGVGVDASLLLGDATARGSIATIRRRLDGIHLTFLTTFVGFGSLVWTAIPAVRELGSMVIAGLVAVLLTTWLFGLSSAGRP